MVAYTVVGLLPSPLCLDDEGNVPSSNPIVIVDDRFERVSMYDVFHLKNREGVHGDTAHLAGDRDTSLQQPRVLCVDVQRGSFIIGFGDVDGADLDSLSLLDFGAGSVCGVPVPFGHGEGRELGVDRAQDAP